MKVICSGRDVRGLVVGIKASSRERRCGSGFAFFFRWDEREVGRKGFPVMYGFLRAARDGDR